MQGDGLFTDHSLSLLFVPSDTEEDYFDGFSAQEEEEEGDQ